MAIENTLLKPSKTYVSRTTMQRALEHIPTRWDGTTMQYIVAWTDTGRCYPIFLFPGHARVELAHHGFMCIG